MKIKLKEKILEEQKVIESIKPIYIEPIHIVPPLLYRSSSISHLTKRSLGILIEKVEKIFLMGDTKYRDNFKIYNEVMSDIDSEKWLEAMKSNVDSIHFNQVKILVNSLEDIVPIGCK